MACHAVAPDQSQWMVCGHSLFEIDIGKQITCPYIRTAHGFLLLLSQQHRNQNSCSNVSLAPQFFSSLLVLLCHKFWCPFRAAQHGQRESVVARAATNLRRIVAIEFGTWRSGRNGGSSGLVTFA